MGLLPALTSPSHQCSQVPGRGAPWAPGASWSLSVHGTSSLTSCSRLPLDLRGAWGGRGGHLTQQRLLMAPHRAEAPPSAPSSGKLLFAEGPSRLVSPAHGSLGRKRFRDQ